MLPGNARDRSRWTRRSIVGRATLAGGALAAGGIFAGCARSGAPPRLAVAQPVTELTFMPWWIYWNQSGVSLLKQATAHFDSTRKGLRLKALPGPQGGGVGTATVLTAILGGAGPDVVGDCCGAFVQYLGANAFLNLLPYLHKDNISLGTWSRGHVEALSTPAGQYALPIYDGPVVLAYRQDILDSLGITYPDPAWTYKEAAALWQRCAGTVNSGKAAAHRYGSWFWWSSTGWYAQNYLLHGFGGNTMDASRTKATFDSPGSIAAAEWVYPLLWDKVLGPFTGSLRNGTAVFSCRGGWDVPHDVVNYGSNFKWDYIPMPHFPQGRATFGNNDFWGINANSKHLDYAWEVMKWLTYEDYWQEFVMRATLLEPCKLSLWDRWETLWVQTAPILKNKQIKWYRDAAVGGYAYPQQFYAYQPVQADALIAPVTSAIYNHKVSIRTGFKNLTGQIDAVEATGKQTQAAQAANLAAIRAVTPSPTAKYPAPRLHGAGVPSTTTPYILVDHTTGTYTMLGDGWDVYLASDNCTFAAAPFTASEGEWSCRVVSVTNLTCPHLSQWSKIGIMARGDLSSDAPMVSTHVTGAHDIEVQYRLVPGLTPAGAVGLAPGASTKGKAAPPLMKPNTQKHKNYLLKPLWLKLQRKGTTWTPFASVDGTHWTQTGKPGVVEMGGCWIGIICLAHNAGFKNKGYIRATMDHLSFKPDKLVQLGSTGVPPAAGPVPKQWATMA